MYLYALIRFAHREDWLDEPCRHHRHVLISRGLLNETGTRLAALTPSRFAALVADDTVDGLYGDRVETSLREAGFRVARTRFPQGEISKTLATYGKIMNFLAENSLTRRDTVVALGGGVTGDLAGFAAATYLRGINVLQIPTTLLAMFSGFMRSSPISIEESAMIDGCQPLRTFFSIVLPILQPTYISTGILETMWIWNDYLLPYLVLDLKRYKTIPIAVQYLKGGYGSVDMGAMMATLVMAIIPIILFYLVSQKYIVSGVMAGAVKG